MEKVLPFCLQNKTAENAFFNSNNELLQNHTGKQIMAFKTTIKLLFNNT